MRAFLSHSSRDKSVVGEVAEHLGAAQVELDSTTFDSGLINVAAIQEALKRCSIFALFVTNDAIASSYVRFEALLAQEFLAKGLVEKFLVICLDPQAFSAAEAHWKAFSFVRHLASPKSIARLIQGHLIKVRSKAASERQPYVERSKELNELKDVLIEPGRPPATAIYISGNSGIGRRTFAKRFYKDRYPAVNSIFPEIKIGRLDGLHEIYRKLNSELQSNWPLSGLRARIYGFSIADDNGKATQIAQLLDQLVESREAIFFIDDGGLLDNDGELQEPISRILSLTKKHSYPSIIFIAERKVPLNRRGNLNIAYCALPSMTRSQVRQLAGFLLKDAKIPYSNDDLNQIIDLCDGHPFNVKFLVESAVAYTLPAVLADTTDLTQWKRKRGSDFLQKIDFNDNEKMILSALRDFNTLDFETIHAVSHTDIASAGKSLAKLMDFHIVEGAGDIFQIAPPLRVAVGRDPRFSLSPDRTRAMLKIVSDSLKARTDADEISVSMVEAGILAILEQEGEVPPLFSAFLLPSHLVWLARRRYDSRQWNDSARLALTALESVDRLSLVGKVEACRLLCLSSARLEGQDNFEKGIAMLRTWASDSWARSNVHFLLGFNERLNGNLPKAEEHFRQAYRQTPGNFSAARELASICMIRGDLQSAEMFARKAIEAAPDNPYILDILLSVLISHSSAKLRDHELEVDYLFKKLENVGEDDGRSFYTTRRAEYEFKHGSKSEACRLIDHAVSKTPGIFNIHALRAKIYLDRGITTIAWEEIERMRNVVFRDTSGERRTNLRSFLEIEASYLATSGNYDAAKKIYRTKNVFTRKETERGIKYLDYEQAMRRG